LKKIITRLPKNTLIKNTTKIRPERTVSLFPSCSTKRRAHNEVKSFKRVSNARKTSKPIGGERRFTMGLCERFFLVWGDFSRWIDGVFEGLGLGNLISLRCFGEIWYEKLMGDSGGFENFLEKFLENQRKN
jgi:hypothetical protein